MIVTLTPNPSLDLTYELSEEGLARGEVQRSRGMGVEAGGKGINVARGLASGGMTSRAVVPAGGFSGERLLTLLDGYGVEVVRVPAAEAVRVNVSLVEPESVVTKVNAPGPQLSDDEAKRLLEETVAAARGAEWLVGCGSLPPGAPADLYARLVAAARRAGCRIAVDASGSPLRAALDASPDLVKPNQHELAEAVGREIPTVGEALAAAKELRGRGVDRVLVSLGADGALLVDGEGASHAESRPFTPRSSVGAGDALLAGFLAGGGEGASALVEGVAWGAAAARQPGSRGPEPGQIDRQAVSLRENIETERKLKGEAR